MKNIRMYLCGLMFLLLAVPLCGMEKSPQFLIKQGCELTQEEVNAEVAKKPAFFSDVPDQYKCTVVKALQARLIEFSNSVFDRQFKYKGILMSYKASGVAEDFSSCFYGQAGYYMFFPRKAQRYGYGDFFRGK